MDSYKYIDKSRIIKGGRVVQESDLANLPEEQLKTFCRKKIIKKLKQKEDVSEKP